MKFPILLWLTINLILVGGLRLSLFWGTLRPTASRQRYPGPSLGFGFGPNRGPVMAYEEFCRQHGHSVWLPRAYRWLFVVEVVLAAALVLVAFLPGSLF